MVHYKRHWNHSALSIFNKKHWSLFSPWQSMLSCSAWFLLWSVEGVNKNWPTQWHVLILPHSSGSWKLHRALYREHFGKKWQVFWDREFHFDGDWKNWLVMTIKHMWPLSWSQPKMGHTHFLSYNSTFHCIPSAVGVNGICNRFCSFVGYSTGYEGKIGYALDTLGLLHSITWKWTSETKHWYFKGRLATLQHEHNTLWLAWILLEMKTDGNHNIS